MAALALAAVSPAQTQQEILDQMKVTVTAQEQQIASLTTSLSAIRGRHQAQVDALAAQSSIGLSHSTQLMFLAPVATDLPSLLAPISIYGKRMLITGVNLQVTNGVSATSKNGRGNLILGANRKYTDETRQRGGSHNIILGDRAQYTGSNGFVGGTANFAGGDYAAILTGGYNEAPGSYAVIGTGSSGRATGSYSMILTGQSGYAWGSRTIVGTGNLNSAGGQSSFIVTGTQTFAHAYQNAILTGFNAKIASNNYRAVIACAQNEDATDSYEFLTD